MRGINEEVIRHKLILKYFGGIWQKTPVSQTAAWSISSQSLGWWQFRVRSIGNDGINRSEIICYDRERARTKMSSQEGVWEEMSEWEKARWHVRHGYCRGRGFVVVWASEGFRAVFKRSSNIILSSRHKFSCELNRFICITQSFTKIVIKKPPKQGHNNFAGCCCRRSKVDSTRRALRATDLGVHRAPKDWCFGGRVMHSTVQCWGSWGNGPENEDKFLSAFYTTSPACCATSRQETIWNSLHCGFI